YGVGRVRVSAVPCPNPVLRAPNEPGGTNQGKPGANLVFAHSYQPEETEAQHRLICRPKKPPKKAIIVGAGPRACPVALTLYRWYANRAGTGTCPYGRLTLLDRSLSLRLIRMGEHKVRPPGVRPRPRRTQEPALVRGTEL